ncbi:MAG: hypothetical protein IK083_03775 [Abditibacteriota bacterium]|nr:hypothetical protein [Abditibacteriota bacterium]
METKSDIRNRRAFTEHLTRARILTEKGEYAEASAEAAEALKLSPNDPDARELTADILAALGKRQAAAEEYKKLFTEDKSRESAEEKYALLILNQYDDDRKAREEAEPKASKKPSSWTLLLTAIVPGVGAMLQEKYLKGGILFGLWLIFFCLAAKGMGRTGSDPMKIFTSLPSLAACAVWLYSFIDTLAGSIKK